MKKLPKIFWSAFLALAVFPFVVILSVFATGIKSDLYRFAQDGDTILTNDVTNDELGSIAKPVKKIYVTDIDVASGLTSSGTITAENGNFTNLSATNATITATASGGKIVVTGTNQSTITGDGTASTIGAALTVTGDLTASTIVTDFIKEKTTGNGVTIQNNLAIGEAVSDESHVLNLKKTNTTTTDSAIGARFLLSQNPTGDTNADYTGFSGESVSDSTNSFDHAGTFWGGYFKAYNYGTGILSKGYGAYSDAFNWSTGEITAAKGMRVAVANMGAGNIADGRALESWIALLGGSMVDGYSLYVKSAMVSGGAVLTNNYGLYIEDQSAGVNNYSIYSAGGDNYFAGDVIINGDLTVQPSTDSTTAIQFLDSDGGTPILNVDTTNERVGIGTNNPGEELEVENNQNGITTLKVDNTTNGTSAGSEITVGASGAAGAFKAFSAGYTTAGSSVADGMLLDANSASAGGLSIAAREATADIRFYAGGSTTPQVFIQQDGNVGIGNTTPSSAAVSESPLLSISGTVPLLNLTETGVLGAESDFFMDSDILYIQISGASTAAGNNAIVFRTEETDSQSTPTERMRIDKDGNVGIGVTDPDTKLEILNAGNQLKLSFDGTDNATFGVDTAGDLTITPSGSSIIIPAGKDINTVAWTDYGGTSTITGWAATPTADIRYKKIGNLVYVNFYITGTSNSTTVTFTLPYTNSNSGNGSIITTAARGADNGSWLANASLLNLSANSTTVIIYKELLGAADQWTASGTKSVAGQFWFEAQ